jgi:serine/threonine-protein kinase
MGNIVINGDKLSVVDFADWDYGDPWLEFTHMFWCSDGNPGFAVGCINGYFNGNPPKPFFELFTFYTVIHALESLCHTNGDEDETECVARREAAYLLRCTKDLTDFVPLWYEEFNLRK